MRRNRWIVKKCEDENLVAQLQKELNDLPFVLARMLAERGVRSYEDARTFFRAGLKELHDPFLMKDMHAAVARLTKALDENESILVYGDYDVDGTSSTALLTGFLRRLGADVSYFIPDRFEDGYGLSKQGIDQCLENGAGLIIALDCGITALKEAAYVRPLGIDLIICDHHTPHAQIPDAVAVLDPKRIDCPYPFKELCGCGVTFKLVQALLIAHGKGSGLAEPYLDLVALATASDLVSVTGENRILLREGIDRLRNSPRTGIRCLAEEAKTRLSDCTVSSIVFTLGPRINAAGRLGDAGRSVSLLLTEDEVEGAARARQLERLNQERRVLDRETLDEAMVMAERQILGTDRHAIVLHDPEWHLGVIGIVASRLVERFYRPVVMLTSADGYAKGSARSINGINIFQAIHDCEDLLTEYGGHDYAAGLTLPLENVEAFERRFDESVAAQVSPELLDPVLEIDGELSLSAVDRRFWAVLKQFEPFGPGNGKPVFLSNNLTVTGEPKIVGRERNHLKFSVRDSDPGAAVKSAIGFRMSDYIDILLESKKTGIPIALVYSLEENTWNGRTALQLHANDLRLQD